MSVGGSLHSRAHEVKSLLRDGLDLTLTRLGLDQPESRLARDSQSYWNSPKKDEGWKSNSHWRDGSAFADGDTWLAVGKEHLALYERFARAVQYDRPLRRVVEWGCGGGANAVHFAPRSQEFVGVDVTADTLSECEQQVRAVCDTPFIPVLADVAAPESAALHVPQPCDLFLCFYVLELVPTPEYGLRLLRIARGLLADDGLAVVQIKYRTDSWRTRSRRRRYRSSTNASMTTYRIDEFWTAASECGLRPELITLVPKNALDERYAYFLLTKAD
jgi:SAM-dependent methyltransferase